MHRKVDEIHRALRALWKDLARTETTRGRKERKPAARTSAERAPTARTPAKRTRSKVR
jgi:hypothetical protein